MAENDALRAKAHAIAWDDCSSEVNGYLSWESNHASCGYGCCGGGKEIDRAALEQAIYEALRDTGAPQMLSALKAIRETYRGVEDQLGATVAAKIRAIDEAIAAAEGKS